MAAHTDIRVINDPPNYPDGVDIAWFELSKKDGDTVTWINTTSVACDIDFGAKSPFTWNITTVPANGGTSGPHAVRSNYPIPPNQRKDRVCQLHKYDVIGAGGAYRFDPGGGVRP